MKQWTRLGYAFASAIVVSCLTLLGLALISTDLALALMYGDWVAIYWFGIFLLAYLLAPSISRHLKSRGSGNPEQSMGYLKRCAYALAFTIVTSAITLIVLAFISKEWAFTFFYDNYYVGIFVIAFLLAPTVNRYLKSHRRSSP